MSLAQRLIDQNTRDLEKAKATAQAEVAHSIRMATMMLNGIKTDLQKPDGRIQNPVLWQVNNCIAGWHPREPKSPLHEVWLEFETWLHSEGVTISGRDESNRNQIGGYTMFKLELIPLVDNNLLVEMLAD